MNPSALLLIPRSFYRGYRPLWPTPQEEVAPGADLTDADLYCTDITGADLMDVTLRGADLRHADLYIGRRHG